MKSTKGVIQVLVAVSITVLVGATALAQGTFVVVPGGLANTEGNSSMTEPFNSPSFRMQMVIDASQFAFLGSGTGRIDQIAFRVDGASEGGGLYFFAGSTIQLSTTPKAPDSLSPVFSENIGTDAVTIWNGALPLGNLFLPGLNPQPFSTNNGIPAEFLYSPSMGNLLLDIRAVSGITVFPGGLDAQFAAGDSISRVFADGNLATSGTVDTLGLVTRFSITVVPEPSVPVLALLGLLSAAILYSRQRI